jgi:hypothetical protein
LAAFLMDKYRSITKYTQYTNKKIIGKIMIPPFSTNSKYEMFSVTLTSVVAGLLAAETRVSVTGFACKIRDSKLIA